ALDAPVAIVAEALPGARADHEARTAFLDHRRGERAVRVGDRDVPAGRAGLDAEGLDELQEAVHYVRGRPRLDAPVAERPLEIARACPVEADAYLGARHAARGVRAHRCVHVQQHREAPALELALEVEVTAHAPG